MLSDIVQTKAIVIDYSALTNCVRELGGSQPDMSKLLLHFRNERGVRRVLHQIHVVSDANGLPQTAQDELAKVGASIHKANGARTECLVFLHTMRMAETFDVVALLVADAGYLPLIRHAKTLGARVELHAMPSSDPPLFWAADEVIGLFPPGAPKKRGMAKPNENIAA